jgi:hypothetical protein
MPETTAPEKLKHLSAQLAIEPQSSVDLGQGLPWGQQSAWGEVREASGVMARAIPPASGSAAIEKATKVTKMARPMLMVQY